MKLKNYFADLAALIFITFVLFQSCSDNNNKSDAYGNFEATEILVSSEISGKILKFEVKEGDFIKKDEPVCYIDDYQLKLKKKELEAQKDVLKSKIVNINSQIEIIEEQKRILLNDKIRFNKMLDEAAATQKQVDDIVGQIKVFERQIENVSTQKQSVVSEMKLIDVKIAQIDDQIQRCVIKNPCEGTVITKFSETGEICGPNKPLYKLADLGNIYLRAYISEKQLSTVRLGQETEIIVDDENAQTRSYSGKIIFISDKSEFTPKTIQTKEERVKLVYSVKVSIQNDGYIRIGMPAELKLKK